MNVIIIEKGYSSPYLGALAELSLYIEMTGSNYLCCIIFNYNLYCMLILPIFQLIFLAVYQSLLGGAGGINQTHKLCISVFSD